MRQVINPRRERRGGAWNRGLALARGKFCAVTGAETVLRDDALGIFAAALEKHGDCVMAYADQALSHGTQAAFAVAEAAKTVKFPDYAPIDTLFFGLGGGVQFWRTGALRRIGGFDETLQQAGGHEAMLKMMAARECAVHVAEVLDVTSENPADSLAEESRGRETESVLARHRGALNIANILQTGSQQPLGRDFKCPGGVGSEGFPDFPPRVSMDRVSQEKFAQACLQAALEINPENRATGVRLLALHLQNGQLKEQEAEFGASLAGNAGLAAVSFTPGEGASLPALKHAVVGPVYHPAEWSSRPSAQQLAREPKALQPWITRIDGRHVYLGADLFPQREGLAYQPAELEAATARLVNLLAQLPPFHAHFGGAGDALLLLAAFYPMMRHRKRSCFRIRMAPARPGRSLMRSPKSQRYISCRSTQSLTSTSFSGWRSMN